MNQKINIQDLVALLAEKSIITKREAENFIKQWLECIEDGLIEDKKLKIKDLGTFKLIFIKDRESVDVSTGERLLIPAHYKINFDADSSLSETINEPFALFEPIEVPEESPTDDSSTTETTREKKIIATQIDLFLKKEVEREEKENIIEEEITEEKIIEEQNENEAEKQNEIQNEIQEEEINKQIKEEAEKKQNEQQGDENEEREQESKIQQNLAIQQKKNTRNELISLDDMEDDWNKKRRKKRRKTQININWKLILVIIVILLVFGIIKYINIQEEKDYYQRNRRPQTTSAPANEKEENAIEESETTVLPDSLDNGIVPEPEVEPESEKQTQSETEENVALEKTGMTETVPEPTKPEEPEVKPTQTSQEPQTQTPAAQTQTQTANQTQTTQPATTGSQKKRKIANGEQLTSIAQEEYGNMIFWIYIYLENNSIISNPNAVPSGIEITIPPASKYKINKNDPESIQRATDLQAQLF